MKLDSILLAGLFTIVFLAAARGKEEEKPPVPEDARVSAEVVRKTWFIGENVLIHFKLETTGGSFKAGFGGDYRGAGFATRFRLKVADADGNLMPDLNHGNNMGGLGGDFEVTPQKPFWQNISLMYHADITEPGDYEITIQHDYGWSSTPNWPLPSATIKISLVEPSADEAATLARGWLEEPKYGGDTWGKKGGLRPNFQLIRHSAYLEPLREAAVREGDENAIIGIASILTPASTRVLLEIAGDSSNPAWQKALGEAMRRMPKPEGQGFGFGATVLDEKRLKSWIPDLNSAARDAARKLLGSATDYGPITNACAVLVSFGHPEDASALSKAIDRNFVGIDDRPEHEAHALVWHQQYAAEHLIKRGAAFSLTPKTPGEIIFYISKLKAEKKQENWPGNWRTLFKQLLVHASPHIRRAALEVLPEPLQQEFFPAFQVILKSNHVEPRKIVCGIIERDQIGFFQTELLELIETTDHGEVLVASVRAAAAVGAGWEAAELVVERIAEPELASPAIRSLTPLVFQTDFSGWSSNPFENTPYLERWRAVIQKHEAAIRAGELLPVPHADLVKELIPPQHRLNFPDGSSWPDWN
jgi:hypothetical protein